MSAPREASVAILAHRGYAARYPENTLAALAAAIDAGASAVEFDIQLSRDAVPVLLHDESLARTAGVDARVGDLDATALSRLSAGEPSRLGERFAAEPLPTLSAAVALLARHPVKVFAEIKGESVGRFGLEPVLGAILPALAPLAGAVVVISFLADVLAAARASHGVPIGWCIASYDEASRSAAQSLRPEYLLTNYRGLPLDDSPLWPGAWRWVLYEVTDPVIGRRLAARGADVIETMAVAEMRTDPFFRGAL